MESGTILNYVNNFRVLIFSIDHYITTTFDTRVVKFNQWNRLVTLCSLLYYALLIGTLFYNITFQAMRFILFLPQIIERGQAKLFSPLNGKTEEKKINGGAS